jgi:hypothetical protein
MKTIRSKIEGNTILNEDTELHGMIVGTTTVCEGTVLALHGMVVGDLVLRPDSTVHLHGMVCGDVRNEGGRLDVFGMVQGRVIRADGLTIIHPKAVVLGGMQ